MDRISLRDEFVEIYHDNKGVDTTLSNSNELQALSYSAKKTFAKIDRTVISEVGIKATPYTVMKVDLSNTRKIYEEYIAGMINFIKEVSSKFTSDTHDSDEYEAYETKINSAIENDMKFIKDLFNGRIPDNPLSEMTAELLLANFAEIIPVIDNKYIFANQSYEDFINSIEHKDNVLVKEAISLFAGSVRTFIREYIETAFECYDIIANNGPVSDDPNIMESYKLF